MTEVLPLAIIGSGIAGLTLAGALTARGIAVTVYEQANRLARVGAGIQQSPNAIKVLRELGLGPALTSAAFAPADFVHRTFDTGEITNRIPLGATAEEAYGAPYLLLHRAALYNALLSSVPPDTVQWGSKLLDCVERGDRVELRFADGRREVVGAVVGADGINSVVRHVLLGPQGLRFSGRVGYRATFSASALGGHVVEDNVKWWAPDRHMIVYHLNAARDELYAMGVVPDADFDVESWSARGDLGTLRTAFEGFHPVVQRVIDGLPEVHKWALADRDPLARWSEGNVVLMGDAAHPMMPHMGQGAAMAIEDAAVLARCIDTVQPGDWSPAFRLFEATRKLRTSHMQEVSNGNTFARTGRDLVDWVYGYDAWNVPLGEVPETTDTR